MLTFANSHFLPFQIDSRVKYKDLRTSFRHSRLPSPLPLFVPLAFPDPSKGWAAPFPRASRGKQEIGLSGHDCPKGVGLFLLIGSGQKTERACPHTIRDSTPSANCPPSKMPSVLANNRKHVKDYWTFYIYKRCAECSTERLFRETF